MNKMQLLFFLLVSPTVFAQQETTEYEKTATHNYNVGNDGLAVDGYDLVAYFKNNVALKGSPKYTHEHDGIKYYFRNKANLLAFIENPENYLPQFGGYCAFGIALDPEIDGEHPGKYPIDPKTFKIIDDKLYLFYNFKGINALNDWEMDEPRFLKQAKKQWEQIRKGNK